MKKFVKALCVLLALCCFLPILAACKGGDSEGGSSTAPTATQPPAGGESLYDAEGYLKDTLPALDYDGEQISILTWNPDLDEFCFIEEDGRGLIDDAMFRQHVSVEERLDVDIKLKQIPGRQDDSEDYLREIEQASLGDAPYDLVGAYSGIGAMAAMNGLYYDLNSLDYLDFQKPWWPDDLQNSITINNHLYFASGDISPNLIYCMFAIFINLDLLDNYFHDREMIYDLVDNNEWTLDKMIEMSSEVYEDINNVGHKDESDRFGFAFANSVTIDVFLQGNGIDITAYNQQGELKMSDSFFSQKADDVASKLNTFLKSNNCIIPENYAGVFPDGGSMLFAGRIDACIVFLSNAEFKYGVVPIPKYDSDQKNFVTTINHNFSVYGVPKALTMEEANRSAAFMEAMGSKAYRSVTPVIFEMAFQLKYSSTSRVSEMFDKIRGGIKFDMGRLYRLSFGNSVPDTLFRDVVRGDGVWLSKVASWKRRWNDMLGSIQDKLK